MNDRYTFKQVMQRLGMQSATAFRQLIKKYPEVFIMSQQGRTVHFDKAAVEKFAAARERMRDFPK